MYFLINGEHFREKLGFGFSIENELKDIQDFTTQVGRYSTNVTQTSRSYRVTNDNQYTFDFLGNAFLTGNFTYKNSYDWEPSNVSGPITDFSMNYKENCDYFDGCDGNTGSFAADKLGKYQIQFKDFISLQPRKLASKMLGGNDKITGSNYDDQLKGYNGNDIIAGGKGKNKCTGGKGSDTFKFDKKGIQIITDFDAREDNIDLPGKPSSWGKYGYYQKSKKQIYFGYYKDDLSDDYRMSMKSKQPISIDDIQFI